MTRSTLQQELLELTQQAQALIDWFEQCGSEGLAMSLDLQEVARQAAAQSRAALPHGGPSRPSGTHRKAQAPSHQAPQWEAPQRQAPQRQAPQWEAPQQQAPENPRPDKGGPPRPPPKSKKERTARLQQLASAAEACEECPLHEGRTLSVFCRGSEEADLMFIGEGPGREEDAQGKPFVGAAGQLLDKMIGAMNIDPADVYIANIVKCRPPDNRKPTPEEMTACMSFIEEQIELVSPRIIVALGATAASGLLGTRAGITRLRGTWKLYRGRIPVMPTFHPAYLLRQAEKKREVWSDLKQVMKRLNPKLPRES